MNMHRLCLCSLDQGWDGDKYGLTYENVGRHLLTESRFRMVMNVSVSVEEASARCTGGLSPAGKHIG